jgi:hypothetical protein
MTAPESAGDALFRDPLPAGFCKGVLRVAPGFALDVDASCVTDAIVIVADGELELECRSGTSRRFGRGSMIPIGRLRIARVRNVGPRSLMVVAVLRCPLPASDEFLSDSGSYSDC